MAAIPCRRAGKALNDKARASENTLGRSPASRRLPIAYWERDDGILPTPTLDSQIQRYLNWSSSAVKPATRFALFPILFWVWRAVSPQDQPPHGPLTNSSQSALGRGKSPSAPVGACPQAVGKVLAASSSIPNSSPDASGIVTSPAQPPVPSKAPPAPLSPPPPNPWNRNPRVDSTSSSIPNSSPDASGIATSPVQPASPVSLSEFPILQPSSSPGSPSVQSSNLSHLRSSPPEARAAAASTSISHTCPNPSGSPTCPAQPVLSDALLSSPPTPPTHAGSRAPERSTSPTQPPKLSLPPSQAPLAQPPRSSSPCSEDEIELGPGAKSRIVRGVEIFWNGLNKDLCCKCRQLDAWSRSMRVCGMPLCPRCMYKFCVDFEWDNGEDEEALIFCAPRFACVKSLPDGSIAGYQPGYKPFKSIHVRRQLCALITAPRDRKALGIFPIRLRRGWSSRKGVVPGSSSSSSPSPDSPHHSSPVPDLLPSRSPTPMPLSIPAPPAPPRQPGAALCEKCALRPRWKGSHRLGGFNRPRLIHSLCAHCAYVEASNVIDGITFKNGFRPLFLNIRRKVRLQISSADFLRLTFKEGLPLRLRSTTSPRRRSPYKTRSILSSPPCSRSSSSPSPDPPHPSSPAPSLRPSLSPGPTPTLTPSPAATSVQSLPHPAPKALPVNAPEFCPPAARLPSPRGDPLSLTPPAPPTSAGRRQSVSGWAHRMRGFTVDGPYKA